jgi:DNA-binding MarR family transcriptional regulator
MAGPFYTLDFLEANNSIGFLIKRCGIVMSQMAEREFESQPVSFTQWLVLATLNQRPHASPTELSLHLGHDMGALTRVVDDLEHEGLVRRDRSQHDRRAVQIAITPEGGRVAQAGKRVLVDLLNVLVAPYTKAEVDALISLLQRLLVRLQDVAETSTAATTSTSSAGPQSAAPSQRARRSAGASTLRRSRATGKQPGRKTRE